MIIPERQVLSEVEAVGSTGSDPAGDRSHREADVHHPFMDEGNQTIVAMEAVTFEVASGIVKKRRLDPIIDAEQATVEKKANESVDKCSGNEVEVKAEDLSGACNDITKEPSLASCYDAGNNARNDEQATCAPVAITFNEPFLGVGQPTEVAAGSSYLESGALSEDPLLSKDISEGPVYFNCDDLFGVPDGSIDGNGNDFNSNKSINVASTDDCGLTSCGVVAYDRFTVDPSPSPTSAEGIEMKILKDSEKHGAVVPVVDVEKEDESEVKMASDCTETPAECAEVLPGDVSNESLETNPSGLLGGATNNVAG